MQDFDIVCLSETKSDDIEKNAITNFVPICKKKSNVAHRFGGYYGICIFVRLHLESCIKILDECNSDSVLWVKIDEKIYTTEMIIGATYIPHEGSPYHDGFIFDEIGNDITELTVKYNCPIVMLGTLIRVLVTTMTLS